MRAEVQNAADRKQVRKARNREKLREQQRRADLQTVLGTAEGRRVLGWLLNHLQPRRPMWQPDAYIQFNAARHDVGTWLKDRIDEVEPHGLLNIFAEEQRMKDASREPDPETKVETDEEKEE